MKKVALLFLIIIFNSEFALANDTSDLKRIYRKEYLNFYNKVVGNIEQNSRNGIVAYNNQEVEIFYKEMVEEIKKKVKDKGIKFKVYPYNNGDWGFLNGHAYKYSAESVKDVVTRRVNANYLSSRGKTLEVIAANLLKKGWDISRSSYVEGNFDANTYKTPVLISTIINDHPVGFAGLNLHWDESINSRTYYLEEEFISKSKNVDLKKAELAAKNWDFKNSKAYYLQGLREGNGATRLESQAVEAVISNEINNQNQYKKYSRTFENKNKVENFGKAMAILGGAFVIGKSGLPGEEVAALQALYAADVLREDSKLSSLKSGTKQISETNQAISNYNKEIAKRKKKLEEEEKKRAQEEARKKYEENSRKEKTSIEVAKNTIQNDTDKGVKIDTDKTKNTHEKAVSKKETKNNDNLKNANKENKSESKDAEKFEIIDGYGPLDYLTKTNHALVITCKTKNGRWGGAGPVQKTTLTEETEEEVLKYVYHKEFDQIKYIGNYSKYKIYTLGRDLRNDEEDARKIMK